MPFFVELVAPPPPLEEEDEAVLLDAGAPEDPDEAEVELVELDELEPQAASARATSTSASGASRRIDVRVCVLMRSAPSRLKPMGLPYTRLGACCSVG
jgi:hypothetical protein